ncbi:hypothetical protein PsorP6_013297 [Peronosclerospora sorghi]|uniref:Uncharacterized protein n=1 Tax=Peronosclerospora sorghi TaxID=230839 RepID=A0ACC0WG27_9STRA|nr:hypothetical protein PsorP6_013297 [Peronosclerospora sorghi]
MHLRLGFSGYWLLSVTCYFQIDSDHQADQSTDATEKTSLTTPKLVTCSPRERTPSEHMVTVGRSFIDGIGLCGPLKTILASAMGADWIQLKVQALETFQRVLEWDSPALGSDEPLDLNVRALKRVAI